MRKIFVIIGILLSCCILFAGCGSPENHFLLSTRERNIIKDEYDERYNHYENELKVDKKAALICVSGNADSGMINLKIIENDEDGNAVQTYEYQITDILNETIEVDKKHSENWTVIADFNKDSEGSYKIEVYD